MEINCRVRLPLERGLKLFLLYCGSLQVLRCLLVKYEAFFTVLDELVEFLLRVEHAQQVLVFLKYRIELTLGELTGFHNPPELLKVLQRLSVDVSCEIFVCHFLKLFHRIREEVFRLGTLRHVSLTLHGMPLRHHLVVLEFLRLLFLF